MSKGKMFVISGASGVGKSTVLKHYDIKGVRLCPCRLIGYFSFKIIVAFVYILKFNLLATF